MDLMSVAERVASLERSHVSLEARRCLHSTDRFSACRACQGVCPVGAIQPGRPPSLDAQVCAACLACLPVCPTGAFTADDAVPALLNCAARLECHTLELICQRHPHPEHGLAGDAAAIRVRGCLAGLGVGGLLALSALGVEHVILRADACALCEWGGLQTHLDRHAAQAQRVLAAWGLSRRVNVAAAPPAPAAPRRLVEADNPPLSRRDLFRLAARRGQVMTARAVMETRSTAGPHPARERQRVLNALAALPARQAPAGPEHTAGPGYAGLAVSAACSACGACARACPTGALRWEHVEPAAYRLTFQAPLCNGCEACRHACGEDAITLDAQPSFEAVFGDLAPRVVSAGDVVRCQRCGAWTAAAWGSAFCPTCDFRRKHPFGVRPMPGLNKVRQ